MLLLLLMQAAASPPDIQLDVRATVRDVRIEQRGETKLEVRGGPGSDVRVERPDSNGRNRLRNVVVRVQAEARIADPLPPQAAQEPEPQS
jgi:hypothetical protein